MRLPGSSLHERREPSIHRQTSEKMRRFVKTDSVLPVSRCPGGDQCKRNNDLANVAPHAFRGAFPRFHGSSFMNACASLAIAARPTAGGAFLMLIEPRSAKNAATCSGTWLRYAFA